MAATPVGDEEPPALYGTDPVADSPDVDPGTPTGPRRRTLLYAVIVVAVIAVVLVLVIASTVGLGSFKLGGAANPPTLVKVDQLTLNFTPGSEPCWSSQYQTTHTETVLAGGTLIFNVSLTNDNPNGAHACVVTGITVNTSEFTLESSNAPLNVGTGSGTLTFTLLAPDSSFNGSVFVTANTSYTLPNIQVSAQNFTVTGGGGQCGSVTASGIGFSAFSGGTYADSALVISISPAVICSINGISMSGPPGFSIRGSNVPVQLPIDSLASLSFTLGLPSTAYQGGLNYTVSLAT